MAMARLATIATPSSLSFPIPAALWFDDLHHVADRMLDRVRPGRCGLKRVEYRDGEGVDFLAIAYVLL